MMSVRPLPRDLRLYAELDRERFLVDSLDALAYLRDCGDTSYRDRMAVIDDGKMRVLVDAQTYEPTHPGAPRRLSRNDFLGRWDPIAALKAIVRHEDTVRAEAIRTAERTKAAIERGRLADRATEEAAYAREMARRWAAMGVQ